MNATQTTEQVVSEMLKENTGRALLDSGDYYGRHWEQNQSRKFQDEPEAWIQADGDELIVSLNVYHFLIRALEYAPGIDRAFHEWSDRPENKDKYWLELMEEFPNIYAKKTGQEVGGLYGEGAPFTVNTYNGDDLLSQVIQYHYFEIDGDPFALLQIHNGCDVRGGYTQPRAFRVYDDDLSIFDNARADIICENGHGWHTDDGYHWYPHSDEPELTIKGGKAVCPVCGKELKAYL